VAFVRRQRRLADPLIDLRLFRIPAFSVSAAANTLGGFIVFGTFLFIAQYLQLVVGLSPLQAGLWTLPSSLAVIAGSMLAPAVVRRVRPAFAVAGGMALAAAGLTILTQVDAGAGVAVPVVASIVFSPGLGPAFILTTSLIVGTAPPERAGAASAISETGAEFGGALGIAVLGSIGTALYRSGVAAGVPSGLPSAAVEAARDTLGGALAVAHGLPGRLGDALADAALTAFTSGLRLTAAIAAVIAIGVAIFVAAMLREVQPGGGVDEHAVAEGEGAAQIAGAPALDPATAEC
jgi:DHA2 family multidrug resistance protein-like MFS transporter